VVQQENKDTTINNNERMYDNDAMVSNQTLYITAKSHLCNSQGQSFAAAIHLVTNFEFKQNLEFKAIYSMKERFCGFH
jgi:hypothetical protein